MTTFSIPECTCGSKECRLILVPTKGAYQCGTCINVVYEKLGKLKTEVDTLRSDNTMLTKEADNSRAGFEKVIAGQEKQHKVEIECLRKNK